MYGFFYANSSQKQYRKRRFCDIYKYCASQNDKECALKNGEYMGQIENLIETLEGYQPDFDKDMVTSKSDSE